MRNSVDHEERREMILSRSLQLFAEQGYQSVTYQKIADRCGLSRTILYRYFKDKREIFDESVLRVVSRIDGDYHLILQEGGGVVHQLTRVMEQTFDRLVEQEMLLNVILYYLIHLRRTGERNIRRITRHTYKVRRLLVRLLLRGVESGELHPLNVSSAERTLYGMFEACVFQLTVSERFNVEQNKASARLFIEGLRADSAK
ncbi:MAG: TetR/AcrR family transcriptional regulator [Kiritimatiellae bacterium]|nr:TetR/AcrR family transcriptional regulator [Kiritimatiellia bacterium]